MKLMPVYDIKALLNLWPLLSKDVEQVLIYSTGDTSLTKVFNDLYSAKLLLWCLFTDNKYCGFITTQINEVPFKDKKERSLWLPHLFLKKGTNKEEFLNGIEQIKEFAKKRNCSTLRFWSRRDKGFSKRMQPLGWRHGYQEFIYDIKQEGSNDRKTK
jgi:hypothetical protein